MKNNQKKPNNKTNSKKSIQNKKNNEKQESKNTNLFYVLIALILAVGTVIAFMIFNPFKENMVFNPFKGNNENSNLNFSESSTLERPKINYNDGQVIELQDLNILWQECKDATTFKYKIITLAGQPNYKNINEGAEKNATLLSENIDGTNERFVTIKKENLQMGKWIKIAVAACNGQSQSWSSTYVYINWPADKNNTHISIKQQASAPVADGIISANEYGEKIHSVNYSNKEFIAAYDTDKSIKADFYMSYDSEYIYAAWVVYTDNHWTVDDYNKDGKTGTPDDLTYMWKFSSVQFMLCVGEPDMDKKTFQTYQWTGNYLEAGLSILEGHKSESFIYSMPKGFEGFAGADLNFCGKRNTENKTTIYEIKIPCKKIGFNKVEKDMKLGFSYAIGDQEDFDESPNMVEWQDAILGIKNMDAGATVILK